MATKKDGINKSEFCRNHINKIGIKNASLETMREAWDAEGHKEDEPSSALFYQQTKRIRDGHKVRGLKSAASRAANGNGSKKNAAAALNDATQSPLSQFVQTPSIIGRSTSGKTSSVSLLSIEGQLEVLTAAAESLKSPKLANALRQARRQAGAEILAAG